MIKQIRDPNIFRVANEMEAVVTNTRAEKGFYKLIDYINHLERENFGLKQTNKNLELKLLHGQNRK